MQYKNLFSINKNFQYSVNVEFDLNNHSKIEEYIPTTDICDVLKIYVRSALGMAPDKATTLVGPYGKGKSFLLLVLSYILEERSKNSTDNILIKKIKNIDIELYELIQQLDISKTRLLPVIINSNYDNLAQSFQLALNDALKRVSVTDIIPETVYDVCLNLLYKWQADEELNNKIMKVCENQLSINLLELKEGLTNYSLTSYKNFEKLYNCVTVGLEFNPLVNQDIIKIYENVTLKLREKNYSGIFIIFDEFTKFFDSSENIAKDLKILQEIAELANRTPKDAQLHICCITHRSFKLYNQGDHIITNTFKTVEGRFKEIRFNRSLDDNYQIISNAIIKDNAEEFITKQISTWSSFYTNIAESPTFFDKERDNLVKTLFKGCFPLNPMTVFSLIYLSEIVAQNERTLFTFLSDTDEHSFNSFINNNKDIMVLFNVDKIYDYFNPILRKEESVQIKNIWYKCESSLKKIADINERRVLKSLAVIHMIGDFEKLFPNKKTIALCLHVEENDVQIIIKSLLEKGIIRKNNVTGIYSFATSGSKEIDQLIKDISNARIRNVKLSDIANKINDVKFYLPRKYNEENKITRFFKVIFLEEKEFSNIVNFDGFLSEHCDGVVVNLLKENMTSENIEEKMNLICNDRVIVRYPKNKNTKILQKELKRYALYEELTIRGAIDDAIKEEIMLLMGDLEQDILTLMHELFIDNSEYYYVTDNFTSKTINEKFNVLLSRIMTEVYFKKLIFNNEMINKMNVSSQYRKACINIIDELLEGIEREYSQTSPEAIVRMSVIDQIENNDVREVIDIIKNGILNSEFNKITIMSIIDPLLKKPYGIRIGVISLLFTVAVKEISGSDKSSNNVLLFFKSKEIPLTANQIFDCITTASDEYFISFKKGSAIRNNYLNNLMNLFNVSNHVNLNENISNTVKAIRRFFIGLPSIMRSSDKNNNILLLNNDIIEMKKIFVLYNNNPYETLFIKPLNIFKTDNFEDVFRELEEFVMTVDDKVNEYKKKIISRVKNMFNIYDQSNLKSGMKEWLIKNTDVNKNPLIDNYNKNIYEVLINDLNYDDIQSLDEITKTAMNMYVEDWSTDRQDEFDDILANFINVIKNSEKIEVTSEQSSADSIFEAITITELSPMGELLSNNIESIFNEFSDSITSEEKLTILTKLIKEII